MKSHFHTNAQGQRKLFLINDQGNCIAALTREQFIDQLNTLLHASWDDEVAEWLQDETRLARDKEISELEIQISQLQKQLDWYNAQAESAFVEATQFGPLAESVFREKYSWGGQEEWADTAHRVEGHVLDSSESGLTLPDRLTSRTEEEEITEIYMHSIGAAWDSIDEEEVEDASVHEGALALANRKLRWWRG